MSSVGVGDVAVALFAAHWVGDYWVQTSRQAARKGLPGWAGRLACLGHVVSYTATGVVALALLAGVTSWRPSLLHLVAGLAVSAVTHYIADRRTPLRRLADWLPSTRGFWAFGAHADGSPSLGAGGHALDQAWHIGWIYIAALIVTG